MGFNKRKMDDRRRQAAEQEAAARRASERQILEDAEHLVAAWNERQAKRMPMLFSPTIGAAITAGLLVPPGAVPGLPHHWRRRPADARLAPRRGRDGPYPCAGHSIEPCGSFRPLASAKRSLKAAHLGQMASTVARWG
jgi:hypothetical protein